MYYYYCIAAVMVLKTAYIFLLRNTLLFPLSIMV